MNILGCLTKYSVGSYSAVACWQVNRMGRPLVWSVHILILGRRYRIPICVGHILKTYKQQCWLLLPCLHSLQTMVFWIPIFDWWQSIPPWILVDSWLDPSHLPPLRNGSPGNHGRRHSAGRRVCCGRHGRLGGQFSKMQWHLTCQ